MTSVKVAVRVRPINQREYDLESKFIIQMDGKKTTITNLKIPESAHEGDTGRDLMRNKEFTFDYSFWSVLKSDPMYASQEQVYRSLGLDVVDSAFEGYNACVFAYGQTGSGKSYTMMGGHDDPGLIPRICKDLFSRMSDEDTNYRTEVSYLEIYNEKVRDLLKQHSPNKSMHSLRVREHPKYGPYVQDLSKHIVNDFEDIQDLMNRGNAVRDRYHQPKNMPQFGEEFNKLVNRSFYFVKSRTTASTNMNDVSSRSHAIFTINFTQAKFSDDMPCETSSKIHLVDLAGSERADASGATGQRLKEGASINKSLVTLGSVIKVLAENSSNRHVKNSFIPYRDSVLTWLLKDSLGGNSRTIMIATLSPADVNYGETLSTLRYANRAKNIINRPTVNEDPNVKIIRELREEISRLKALLGGNIDNISTPKVQEKLHQNEARVKVLTEEWAGKWNETATILKDKNLALRKEGLGVVLDSTLPHLIGIDDDILSTGIMLYHLKEGRTTVGRGDAQVPPDIVIAGIDVEENHCIINHNNGEVTLEPLDGAYCVINGTTVLESTKLTQGAVILLGKTNMFRFNHPAEAAKMKQELQNCGLSLSRTSLLSKSMTDLYKSTDNLSLMGTGFELEGYSKDVEKMEEKRREIDILERKYMKSEKDRESRQTSLEKDLEDRQYQLELLNIEMEKFKEQTEEKKKSGNSVKSLQDMLQELDDKEIQLKNAAKDNIDKLQEEIDSVKNEIEKRKKICQVDLSEISDREIMLKDQLKKNTDEIAEMISKSNDKLKEGEEKLLTAVEEVQESVRQFDDKKQKTLEENESVRLKIVKEEEKKSQLIEMFEKEELENKEKWQTHLEEIAKENKSLEEAWNDLKEHEEELNLVMQNIDELTEEQKTQLLNEQKELEQARTLLKCEEKKVSRNEKSLLDKIEKDLDECEKRKEKSLNEIKSQQEQILFQASSELQNMNEEIKTKEGCLKVIEDQNSSCSQEILNLNTRLKEITEGNMKQEEELIDKKRCVLKETEKHREKQEQVVVSLQQKIDEVKKNLQAELTKLMEERQQLLARISEMDEIKNEQSSEDAGISADLAKKQKETEELREIVERKEQELEDKWKEFDEQRDAELYKIEAERLKLQDMEHQERINALVSQEVKRRLFEEKVQRENWRKQEREKERKERDSEIQRLKEQHSRELKLLKAKYEKEEESNASKLVNPTRANPYASIHPPDAESLEELPRRKSTSSSSVSSSMIFISDNITLGASIPSYRLHGYGSDAHYEYEVKICVSDECWTIFRRYSKFRQMHQEHKRRYPEINALVFPPKKLFSRSEKVVMERRRQLELYLRNLLAIFVNSPSCPLHPSQNKYLSKKVLCDFEPFFRKGLFEVTKHGTT